MRVHVYIHTCMHAVYTVCTQVHVHVYSHTYTHAHTHARMHARARARARTHTHTFPRRGCTHTQTLRLTCVCVCVCVCVVGIQSRPHRLGGDSSPRARSAPKIRVPWGLHASSVSRYDCLLPWYEFSFLLSAATPLNPTPETLSYSSSGEYLFTTIEAINPKP